MVRAYINGCSGIKSPKDMHGVKIKPGDKLSWDFGDEFYDGKVKYWMGQAIFIVKEHECGKGLFAEGINKRLYLHDFRFKYCEIIT